MLYCPIYLSGHRLDTYEMYHYLADSPAGRLRHDNLLTTCLAKVVTRSLAHWLTCWLVGIDDEKTTESFERLTSTSTFAE